MIQHPIKVLKERERPSFGNLMMWIQVKHSRYFISGLHERMMCQDKTTYSVNEPNYLNVWKCDSRRWNYIITHQTNSCAIQILDQCNIIRQLIGILRAGFAQNCWKKPKTDHNLLFFFDSQFVGRLVNHVTLF